MVYRLVLAKRADKEMDDFSKNDQKRLLAAFEVLRENPMAGKQLHDKYKGLRSLRVGSYRILYAVDHRIVTVTVVKVGHRKDVYRP
jgi:mRNA interferase RelE/StbE